ncbi:MAG: hypothetical protein AB1646_00555 [Thermodesulfobacteriota bacterium]
MAKRRFIRTKDFLADVRQGLDNAELKRKYGLTQDQLNRAFQKLIDLKAMTPEELRSLTDRKHTTMVLRSFAADLVSGMAPETMATKYSLNWAEYYGMVEKARELPTVPEPGIEEVTVDARKSRKRRINARELAEDFQLGMDYENLMAKYEVSEKQLDSCLKRLIEAKFLTEAEVYDRTVPFDTQLMEAQKVAQASIDELD